MNNKGQALIEALFGGAVAVAGFYFFFKASLQIAAVISTREWAEENLICKASGHADCDETFRKKLQQTGFTAIIIQSGKNETSYSTTFKAESKIFSVPENRFYLRPDDFISSGSDADDGKPGKPSAFY